MSDNPLMGLAETIQTASIKRHPSPTHDINPSTAASKVEPVTIDTSPDSSDIEGAESDEIPVSVLRPVPRQSQLPPLPDLRFEQSYLASIKDAQSWQAVTYITLRDQLFMPLVQGTLWTLVVAGWRHWNKAVNLNGQSVGARVRRWWWGVNNWKVPLEDEKLAGQVKEQMLIWSKYYQAEFSSGGGD